ncbi:hypothetical protein BH24ACT5_BH24ACT5_00250 [soil metagenome]
MTTNQATPTYVVGWNMPGYLPDGEPIECETVEDALYALRDVLGTEADCSIDDEDCAAWLDLVDAVDDGETLVHGPDGYAYWIEATS